jgi:hypothetical protein
MKCFVLVMLIETQEIKEMVYRAPDCDAIYEMVERKAADTRFNVLGVYEYEENIQQNQQVMKPSIDSLVGVSH